MKFSVCLATGYEGLVYPIPFCEPQDLIKTGVLCEKLGYDAVWGNDHITTQHYVRENFPEPPNFYDVLITLAHVAAVDAFPGGLPGAAVTFGAAAPPHDFGEGGQGEVVGVRQPQRG